MKDRFAPHVERVRQAVLAPEHTLDRAVREAALADPARVPERARAYVDTVRRHAHRVTDDDVRALLAHGYSEDQVFELTVSAALGAGLERLDAGLRALGEEAP